MDDENTQGRDLVPAERVARGADEVSADADQAAWAPIGGAAGSGAAPAVLDRGVAGILEGFVAEEELSAGADGSEEEDFSFIPGLRQALHHAVIDSTVAEPAGAVEGASLCEDMAAAAAQSPAQPAGAAEGASLCEESSASGQLEMPPFGAWEADGLESQYWQGGRASAY